MIVYLQIEIEIILIQSNIMHLIKGPENPSRKTEIDSLDHKEKANIAKLNSQLLSQLRNNHEHLKSDYKQYESNMKERQEVYEHNESPTDNYQDPNHTCFSRSYQRLLQTGSQNASAEVTPNGGKCDSEVMNLGQMNGDKQNNGVAVCESNT